MDLQTALAPGSRPRGWSDAQTAPYDLNYFSVPIALSYFSGPIARSATTTIEAPLVPAAVRDRFSRLADHWAEETAFSSSTETTVLHPAYQQIIGMGREALPLILERLEHGLSYWFWALAAIAGEDPASGVEEPELARERWLEWARDKGYIT